MKVALVILNWNTEGYLRRWLPGLIASCKALGSRDGQDIAEVVVADNASSDGSVALLESRFPEVKRIVLDRNYGFTGGYNRALKEIEAEYFLLINTDIEVGEGWLKPLVDWMDSHPECGVCGPKLHALVCKDGDPGSDNAEFVRKDCFEYAGAAGGLLDRYGFPFCRGRILSRIEEDRGQYDAPADVLWATGACMMTRSSLWRELGGLDDRFFAHMEEIDYCWRAQLAGYKVTVVPESVVWHLGGGTLPQDSPFKLKLNFRNCLMMLEGNLESSFLAMGMSAQAAHRKATGRLAVRKVLDWAAAAVYLLSGKKEQAKAVRDAHREYRQLRRETEHSKGKRVPDGLMGICIIPLSILKGKKAFNCIK